MAVIRPYGSQRAHATLAGSARWMVVQTLLIANCWAFQLQPPIVVAPSGGTTARDTNTNTNSLCRTEKHTATHACPVRRVVAATPLPTRAGVVVGAAEVGGDGFAEDRRYRRKPRGNSLRRNEAGLAAEKVYAPRPSA